MTLDRVIAASPYTGRAEGKSISPRATGSRAAANEAARHRRRHQGRPLWPLVYSPASPDQHRVIGKSDGQGGQRGTIANVRTTKP
jgi:hypothetical protein